MAKRKINPNFKYLVKCFVEQQYKDEKLISGKRGALLEGSSRSGKTYSSIDFIILVATRYLETGVVNIIKETYAEFKTTLYNDFSKRLDDYGLDNPFHDAKEVKTFNILGLKINFLGADKINKFHGAQCDLLWLNEPLPIAQRIFDQAEMRCKLFWWMDLNPSVTQHWIFEAVQRRSDVGYLRTTYKDNPFISIQEKQKILSYEPWLPGSYDVIDGKLFYQNALIDETNQPPPHPTNVEEGTADEFMWKVYGLGLRGSMKGQIFPLVTWIDKWPAGLGFIYGQDFGFIADPSVTVKYAREGRNIFIEPIAYAPTETSEELVQIYEAHNVSKFVPIIADSSDRYISERKGVTRMVSDLFEAGFEVSKVSKTKGKTYWLLDMKKYRIHIVKNHLYNQVLTEQENYKWKEVNGIFINHPEDGNDHFWDSCFEGNTPILTDRGNIPIKEILVGDLVLTSEGYKPVLNKWENGVKQTGLFRMQFNTFCLYLCCTKDHKIKTENGWTEISKLKSGMTIFLSKYLMEKNTNYIKENDIFHDINEKCIGMFGNITKAKDEKVITYTTLTEIRTTTRLKTLKRLKRLNIFLNIKNRKSKIILNGLKSSATKALKLQKNGINLMKAENGTNNTPKTTISEIKHMENDHVTHAEKNGRAIDFQKQDVVAKFVLEKIDLIQEEVNEVFDLHVKDCHEYFANGVLVHNCLYAHMGWEASQFSGEIS